MQCPPGPQASDQLTAQSAAAQDVERAANGLVGHPHLRLVKEVQRQTLADLRRAALALQPILDVLAQVVVAAGYSDGLGRRARTSARPSDTDAP